MAGIQEENCALCQRPARQSALSFGHVRNGERVELDIRLCETCGTRIEKHIKRAIPKGLMRFSPLAALTRPRLVGARQAA